MSPRDAPVFELSRAIIDRPVILGSSELVRECEPRLLTIPARDEEFENFNGASFFRASRPTSL